MSEQQDNFLGIEWLYSTYMWVWGALLILTVVEVIVPEPAILMDWGIATQGMVEGLQSILTRPVMVVSLILLALTKTFCVAWYYMHLIDERPAIILIACAPFLFSIFLTIGLWPHQPPHSAIKDTGAGPAGSAGGKQSRLEEQYRPVPDSDVRSQAHSPARSLDDSTT